MDLHPGEEVVFDGHPSWRGVMSFYIKGALVALVLAVIAYFAFSTALAVVVFAVVLGIAVLIGLVKRMSTRYVITSERLHIRHGILSKDTKETRVQRVQNVNTEQSVVDRMLRVGTVDFDTAGTDDSDFRFVGVADPAFVVRAVDKAQRAAGGGRHDELGDPQSRSRDGYDDAPRQRAAAAEAPRRRDEDENDSPPPLDEGR